MPETVLNQRYRLDEQIGEGGMAVVYSGQDLLLNRQVAVKILRPQYAADAGFLKRFEREAQSAAGFSHPNIVNVYDVGADGHSHYIVMEHIRGPSLKELIRRHGPFSVDGAIYIIGQVASALDYAHQRGLVHRDIKPQNILVDREGNAKVVDFGIAKGVRDTSLTDAGTGMGTVHYVSPEQARGEPATPASDLYATGVVLYEMLTQRLPFEADSPIGVAMLHVNQAPPPPRQFNPSIPPKVEAIILRTLSKNPAERYPSATAFAQALRHWDAPEEVTPEPPVVAVRSVPANRTDTLPPATGSVPNVPERRPPTKAVRVGGGDATRVVRPTPVTTPVRDDVGCTTWLIGSAILIAIVGLILLAFRVLPSFLDDEDSPNAAATLPTPTAAPPTATVTAAVVATAAPTLGPAPTSTAGSVRPTATIGSVGDPVPSLFGMSVAEAEAELGGRWALNVLEDYSAETAVGLILSQDPQPGVELNEGEVVTVIVSLGPSAISVPAVGGMTLSAAIDEVLAAGFDYATVDEPSQEFAEGIVVRSEPEGAAEPGAVITLVVSMGDVVLVPDVHGYDSESATAELEAAGLLVGSVFPSGCDAILGFDSTFDCATFPDGGVAIMSATPALYVPRGTVVDLVIYDSSI